MRQDKGHKKLTRPLQRVVSESKFSVAITILFSLWDTIGNPVSKHLRNCEMLSQIMKHFADLVWKTIDEIDVILLPS